MNCVNTAFFRVRRDKLVSLQAKLIKCIDSSFDSISLINSCCNLSYIPVCLPMIGSHDSRKLQCKKESRTSILRIWQHPMRQQRKHSGKRRREYCVFTSRRNRVSERISKVFRCEAIHLAICSASPDSNDSMPASRSPIVWESSAKRKGLRSSSVPAIIRISIAQMKVNKASTFVDVSRCLRKMNFLNRESLRIRGETW